MTDIDEVDWAAVERDWRRQQLHEVLVAAAGLAAWCVVGFGVRDSSWWWLVGVAVFVGVALAVNADRLTTSRLASRRRSGARVVFAVRAHVDPGPQLRDRSDVAARTFIRLRWAARALPVPVALVLVGGHWHPLWLALPAAVVLVGLTVANVPYTARLARAGRRWLAKPPGPPRQLAARTPTEKWTSGRRLALLVGGAFLLSALGGLLAALISR